VCHMLHSSEGIVVVGHLLVVIEGFESLVQRHIVVVNVDAPSWRRNPSVTRRGSIERRSLRHGGSRLACLDDDQE
jgi:hypothetical protein